MRSTTFSRSDGPLGKEDDTTARIMARLLLGFIRLQIDQHLFGMPRPARRIGGIISLDPNPTAIGLGGDRFDDDRHDGRRIDRPARSNRWMGLLPVGPARSR